MLKGLMDSDLLVYNCISMLLVNRFYLSIGLLRVQCWYLPEDEGMMIKYLYHVDSVEMS